MSSSFFRFIRYLSSDPFTTTTIMIRNYYYCFIISIFISYILQINTQSNVTNETVDQPIPQTRSRWNLFSRLLSINNSTNRRIAPSLDPNQTAQLARKLGANAMMSSFLFSFSVVPLLMAITSLFTPAPHGFYGRYKRALVNESHLYRHLPLRNRDDTRRFLSLFETTLMVR